MTTEAKARKVAKDGSDTNSGDDDGGDDRRGDGDGGDWSNGDGVSGGAGGSVDGCVGGGGGDSDCEDMDAKVDRAKGGDGDECPS